MRWYFTVEGKPVGQPRHRITRNGGRYIPADHAVHAFKQLIQLRCPIRKPRDGKLTISAICYLPKKGAQDGDEYIGKPDADNIFKAVADAMTGIAYHDDNQVDIGRVRRLVGVPRTEIIIEEN